VTAHPTTPAPPTTSPASTAEPARVGARDWIEVAIEWASGAAAVGMFAYGVALSYAVLHAIAAAAGLPAWAAAVWPLGFEAFMASAALNALAEQRHRRHQPDRWARVAWYPWTLTALTAGASIALNWCHPAIPLDPPPGWLVSVVYGLPPLIAVLAWHLFLSRVTHRHPQPTPPAVVLAVPRAGETVPEHPDPGRDDRAGTAPASRPRPGPARPVPRPRPARPPTRSRPAAGDGDGGLLARARAAAAQHQAAQGRPIGRDALRRTLGVSNQTASDLLHSLRAAASPPAAPDHDPSPSDHDPGPSAPAPTAEAPSAAPGAAGPDRQPATVPGTGNGHPARPVTLTSLVPASLGSRDDRAGVGGDA
jgi:hypothetical protein